MKRRTFLELFGAGAICPIPAWAEQLTARLGFLRAAPAPDATMAALRSGLAAQGYREGQHYVVLPSWGDGSIGALPQLASALLAQRVDLIVTDGTVTAKAARVATASIPIVMAGGLDPLAEGIAATLSRPGGNVTGFATQVIETTGKAWLTVSSGGSRSRKNP